MAHGARAACLLFLSTLPLPGQMQVQEVVIRTHPYTPPSALLRADSNLVETGLTVRDSHGRAVGGLHASDFEVFDNGAPQTITAFSEVRPDARAGVAKSEAGPAAGGTRLPPRYITFFFDDLHVANGSMLFVKQGARAFIARGIKPADRLSIATASGQGDLDFTTDAEAFAEKIGRLAAHERPVVTGYCGVGPTDSYIFLHNLDGQIREAAIDAAVPCAGCGHNEPPAQCRMKAAGIAHTEASATWEQMLSQTLDTLSALKLATARLAQMKGSRILVLTSSGFLIRPGVPPELQSFIDSALRSNIVIHGIGAQGLQAGMEGPKSLLRRSLYEMPVENIVYGTGGHYFKDTNDLGGAMELAADPEASYVLAFQPGSADGTYHTLKIRLQSQSGHSIEFRPGYFSPDPKKPEPSARTRMDEAVAGTDALDAVGAAVAVGAGPSKGGVVPIVVRVTVDVKPMRFVIANGRHMQQIAFVLALFDDKGSFVAGKESIMELALTDQKLASLRAGGLKAVASLDAPPGIYRLRTVVRESMKGSLGASTATIDLRAK